jgi:phage protein D
MATFTLQTTLEIDGTPLDAALESLVEQVVVEDYLHQPDMVTVTFRDIERKVVTDARIRIGSKLRVSASSVGGQAPEVLALAEVTAIEAEYTAAGSRAIVRAYDPSHRFHRGRQTQTYVGMKDSDIARRIAERIGVEVGTVEDSGPVLPHVSQANETDWAFLERRAREIGFEIAVNEGKFSFRKPTEATAAPGDGDYDSTDPLKLVFGQELLEFHPRISSAEQVGEVIVRGWDMKGKQAVIGRSPASATSATLSTGPVELAQTFGGPTFTCVDRPLATQAGVDATARALSERIGSAFAEATGVARGNPKLKAGTAVNVSVVADAFAGKYVITTSRHVFDQDGYRTRFIVSGRLDRSMLGLATAGGGGRSQESRIYGVVVALVTNNVDPDDLGRVKLKFPWLGDDYESDWARLVQLGAGPDSGAVWLPEVNDEVLVAFELGDVSRPYVVGGLWNGRDKPRLGDGLTDNGKVKRRGFVSRKGHRVVLLDGDDKSGVALLTADSKLRISLNETKTEIHVKSDGTIVIESTGDLSVKSSANVNVEASGNLTLKGGGMVKIEGASVDIDGTPITLN